MDREIWVFGFCALQGLAAAIYIGKEAFQWLLARKRGAMKPIMIHHPILLFVIIVSFFVTAAIGFWFVFHPPVEKVAVSPKQSLPNPSPAPLMVAPSQNMRLHLW